MSWTLRIPGPGAGARGGRFVRSLAIPANRTALVETAQTPVRALRHPNLRLQPSAQQATLAHQRANEEYGGNEYGGLPVEP
jgi:hypothetical protein